jgi:hypothetical protein
MMIALCIPTRGVIFARTIESTILSDELPQASPVIIVSQFPIPDSHNMCIQRALQTDCTHIWFVEEDMEIPKGALTRMIEEADKGAEVVAIDYPLTKDIRTTMFYDEGTPLWVGFGCTLISRRIFKDVLKMPWLTAEYTVYIDQMIPFRYHIAFEPDKKDKVYGRYDIWFGMQMKEAGIPITVIHDYVCKHLRISSWERKQVNAGSHEIYEV